MTIKGTTLKGRTTTRGNGQQCDLEGWHYDSPLPRRERIKVRVGFFATLRMTKLPCYFRTKVLIYASVNNSIFHSEPFASCHSEPRLVGAKNLGPLRTGSARNPETLPLRFTQGQGDKIETRLIYGK